MNAPPPEDFENLLRVAMHEFARGQAPLTVDVRRVRTNVARRRRAVAVAAASALIVAGVGIAVATAGGTTSQPSAAITATPTPTPTSPSATPPLIPNPVLIPSTTRLLPASSAPGQSPGGPGGAGQPASSGSGDGAGGGVGIPARSTPAIPAPTPTLTPTPPRCFPLFTLPDCSPEIHPVVPGTTGSG